jgi:hypothetical protein
MACARTSALSHALAAASFCTDAGSSQALAMQTCHGMRHRLRGEGRVLACVIWIPCMF